MNKKLIVFTILLFTLFCLWISRVFAVECTPYTDCRYQGAPLRNADGSIKRSSKAITSFQKIHPCPSTGLYSGSCPGWSVDHVIPLACGGIDAVYNMQWLPLTIKSCSGTQCKDRFERKIDASTPPQPDTSACVNQIVK
jgi:hypothetical protein